MTKQGRKSKPTPKSDDLPLFPGIPLQYAPSEIRQRGVGPVWTSQKAQLIARYLRYFVFITKHGAYIDGFSAPKEPNKPETWAANLVLASEPKWLRQFYLCDLPDRTPFLHQLAAQQPIVAKRTVEVFGGDFNDSVHSVLQSPLMTNSTATFCLLDQFSTECHWRTVQTLAQHKSPGSNKIELFYFLAVGWLFRSLSAFKRNPGIAKAWWGSPNLGPLLEAKNQVGMMSAFKERFLNELGYRYVEAYPIFKREQGQGRIMFFMIHASDHPEAPKLMGRAYRNVVQPLEPDEQLDIEFSSLLRIADDTLEAEAV